MAGRTMAQLILADHATEGTAEPDEHVTVRPDWILAHDLSLFPGKDRMAELGYDRVADPDRVVVVIDHHVPSKDPAVKDNVNAVERWVREQGIEHFYPAGEGISHNVVVEEGYPVPGALLLGADSHTTTHGALGAFATGIGHTDLGEAMGSGELWLRVPETKRVRVEGTLPDGATAKDLALALMDRLTAQGAIYDALEYHGPGVRDLAVHERATLCNLAVELGAMAGMVPPDDVTLEYLEGRAKRSFEPVEPDPDAEYADEIVLDASTLEPLVARPPAVDNVGPVADVAGTAVDQVFLGSCNNSSYADVATFADRIEGETVDDSVDLVVVPGSREALQRMNETGVSNEILSAGGMIGTPGCGPCFGGHGGVLGEGDVCVSTMNRNFPGRMGPGEIYLGSPETAAAAAVSGEILHPRDGA